jgi:pilus assembly protein CpaB
MRFSGLIWWVGAIVLATLAGFLTYSMLSTAILVAKDSPRANGNTRSVVVVKMDVPFRKSITEAELELRDLPADSVPEGAATTFDQVIGKMSTVDLAARQPVLTQHLVTPDIVTKQVALSVPKGKIVTAVPTKSELINNYLVRPGDRIDLLATFDVEVIREQGRGPMAESISLLQNLEVHAIILPVAKKSEASTGDGTTQSEGGVFHTEDESGQSVLLAVDPQDALAIRHILDVGGLLDLALRGPDDESIADVKVVDQFYLAERYQIELVRGNPSRSSGP